MAKTEVSSQLTTKAYMPAFLPKPPHRIIAYTE